jgi:hypothetical protein
LKTLGFLGSFCQTSSPTFLWIGTARHRTLGHHARCHVAGALLSILLLLA